MPGSFQELLHLEDILITGESFLEKAAANPQLIDAELRDQLLQSLDGRNETPLERLRAEINNVAVPDAAPDAEDVNPAVAQAAAIVHREAIQTLNVADLAQAQPTIGPASSPEPFSRFSSTDRVGLAFSGGGIRSATFNLGLLKALDELGVLRHIDYVSSVSGGGYIASWWTAWRSRFDAPRDARFPRLDHAAANPISEPPEVLHLRRFSNFLVPRIGFFEVEFWNGLLAVLSSFVPSVLVATSVLTIAIWAWLVIAWPLQGIGANTSTATLVVLTGVVLAFTEWWWQTATRDEHPTTNKNYIAGVLVTLALLAGLGYLFGKTEIAAQAHITLEETAVASSDSVTDVGRHAEHFSGRNVGHLQSLVALWRRRWRGWP